MRTMDRRLSVFLLTALCAALPGCSDRNLRDARQTLDRWLQANVSKKFDQVVALTSDAAFAPVAKQQGVPLAQVRKDIPQLLALAPEKLEGFTVIGEGRKVADGHYAFTVSERLIKQGKRREKREELHVLREGEAWRVDPTRATEAP